MRSFNGFIVLAASCVLSVGADGSRVKHLIEFGWDEPDARFMREHIAEMQETPFDGCVFHVDYRKQNGAKGSFTWQAWSTNSFTRTDVADAIEDLRNTKFGRFNQNFLRFNTTPAKLDWFDDHSAVLENARLAAEIARAGNCPGILFDIEQYEGELFDYRKQRDAYDNSKPKEVTAKSWEVYAAQACKRGREVMEAFQNGYPDLVVFLTFGYNLPWSESDRGRKPLADCHYGLLAPFLDGMLLAARGGTLLVEGNETAYSWREQEKFQVGYDRSREEVLAIVRDAEVYRKFFSIGFGLWLDYDWRKRGWHGENPLKNYFTPDAFETAVQAALTRADQYVWIYTETPRWWSNEHKPLKLPKEYPEALRNAKRSVKWPP